MNMPQINYPSFFKRAVADIIDALIMSIFASAIVFMMVGNTGSSQAQTGISIITTIGLFLYWAIWESSSYQASPGKMMVSLRVIGFKGKKVDALQSIGRNAAKFLSIAAVFGGIIAILFHPERKGWHDSLSGTEVINANYPIRR
jgi:uncharacterized RDD family membrane protein YckC